MIRVIAFSLGLVGILPSIDASAQAVQNNLQRIQNNKQLSLSREEMDRDQRELTEFKALVVQLSGAEGSASSSYIKLMFAMVREISQTEQKVERTAREQTDGQNTVGNYSLPCFDQRNFSC